MPTQIQLRRGTTSEHSSFTGAAGEVTVDTTKKALVVHDGSTAGGIPVARDSTVVHTTGAETVAGVKTLSSNPVLDAGTANGVAYLNGSKALTSGSGLVFDGSNLGLGVTPSAWASQWRVQQIGQQTAIASSGAFTYLSTNWYADGTNRYITTGNASLYEQSTGAHKWYTAPSGTAGNAITFTQAMTLDASGNLGVGTTSPGTRLEVNGNTRVYGTVSVFGNQTSLTNRLIIDHDGTSAKIYASGDNTNKNLIFYRDGGNEETARITSGGYFKASDNGTYFGSTGTYHEFNQSALSDSTITRASNASYASSVLIARALRSQNSAYNLIYCDSGDGADAEFKFTGDGNGYADGTFNNNGADYAEYFESATGDALTVGATVVLDGNKVREATTADPASAIMGVVRPKEPSKASMVIGNTAWNKWANKYLTDDFDRYIMEGHEVVEWTDADGKQHSYESHNMPVDVTVPANAVRKTHDDKGNKFQHYKLNPAWNSDAEYTPREKRPEWNIIGLVGQVKVLKGKPVNDRWIKMRDVSASVEEWMIR